MRPGTFHGLNLIFSLPKLLQVTARPLQNSGEIRRGRYESGRLLGVKLSTRAVLAAVLSAVTAAAAYLGLIPLIVVVGLLGIVFAVGWSSLLRLPAKGGTTLVVILSGLGALASLAATLDEPWLRYLPIILAMSVFLAFINEMLRAYPRNNLVDSLVGTVSGSVVSISAVGWVASYKLDGGVELAVAGAAALAVASAMSAAKFPTALSSAIVTAASTVIGWVSTFVLADLSALSGAIIGLAAGVIVVALHSLFGRLPAVKGRTSWMSVVTLPIAVMGILTYVIGRIVL